ncbi:serine/threonine protein kinase [Planctomicrobium piriforme]|uniref:Serine/threonine protein kinase n=1 Tax=Planctomicrobium piriforme TaxID=1576369 RepID=A0A1I3C9S1_9PLAN|nr:protein kinase [Planctomicrobium piriforme]SFH71163.1 serine/threonine protein kinase [Planctomicrobium piriforme]
MISGSRLDELLDQWEEALANGRLLTAEELCADCPDLKEPLAQQIATLQKIREKFETQSRSSYPLGVSEPTNVPQSSGDEASVSVMTSVDQLQLYATGGLGRVFSGSDTVLHRDVAVKFLQQQHANRPRMLERFVAEAEITSRLDHPNVVPVHGFGWTATGQPFYVMRLIRGETLDAEIDRFHSQPIRSPRAYHTSEFRNLLQRLKDTCNAIAYAHSRGIVHLDIKPQNILLGRYGETVVVDWGLAATVGREGRFRQNGEQTLNLMMTASGSSSSVQGGGTPAYMSPEQVIWQPPPGPPADLFCLGATLYKVLTGRPPYRGVRHPKAMTPDLARDFPLPREIQRNVPKPLQSICLKAMAMQPEQRYETALDLAADLDRFLGGEHVTVHVEGPGERIARFIQHHRRSAGLVSVLAAMLLIASVVSAARYADIARREADSRKSIEQLQAQTLASSARYAAEMFAGEIESRWTVLDKAAASAELREQLKKYDAGQKTEIDKERLQAWLGDQFLRYRDLNAASWFIVAADGTQLVVAPRKRTESEGENYSHRDYFHGQGRDFERGAVPETVRPIRAPHFSVPYVSTNSNRLKVALSVPVWPHEDGSGEPLGVLGMSTELGHMKVLENAVLIDTRPDRFEDRQQTGLLLQHPLLEKLNAAVTDEQRKYYRFTPEQLARLTGTDSDGHLDPAYHDPLQPDAAAQLAAAAPVIVHDWFATDERREKPTGLLVLVTQPSGK